MCLQKVFAFHLGCYSVGLQDKGQQLRSHKNLSCAFHLRFLQTAPSSYKSHLLFEGFWFVSSCQGRPSSSLRRGSCHNQKEFQGFVRFLSTDQSLDLRGMDLALISEKGKLTKLCFLARYNARGGNSQNGNGNHLENLENLGE